MFRLVCILAVTAMAFAIVAGCSDEDKSVNNNGDPPGDTLVPEELIGVWMFQGATVNGTADSLSTFLPWEEGTVRARISVNNDATFVFEDLNAGGAVLLSESGSFTVDGNSCSLIGDDGIAVSGTWAVNDDTLTLSTTEFGVTVVLTATKQT